MNQEQQFAKTLEEIKQLARQQGNCISEEQVKEAFAPLGFDDKQLEMVYDYLKNQKIGIGEPPPLEGAPVSEEEINYLDSYLESLALLEELTEGEREAVTLSAMAGDMDAKQKLIEIYLPQVVDLSKLYAGQGALLEDLIGEGNVALTMAVRNAGDRIQRCGSPGNAGKRGSGSHGKLYHRKRPGKRNRQ